MAAELLQLHKIVKSKLYTGDLGLHNVKVLSEIIVESRRALETIEMTANEIKDSLYKKTKLISEQYEDKEEAKKEITLLEEEAKKEIIELYKSELEFPIESCELEQNPSLEKKLDVEVYETLVSIFGKNFIILD